VRALLLAALILGACGDRLSQLTANAGDRRPIESLPRQPARDLCASIVFGGDPTVAAAFDSTAEAVARWEEIPKLPDGPTIARSSWRDHPAGERVAVCYLDGDFGAPRGPWLPSASGSVPLDYDRAVYLIALDRRPIPLLFGWKSRVDIVDPGR
jgi:hypothetical protein